MIAAHQTAAVRRGEHPGRLATRRRREPLQRTLGVRPRDRAAARASRHRDDAATRRGLRDRIHRRHGRHAIRRARHGVDGSTVVASWTAGARPRLCAENFHSRQKCPPAGDRRRSPNPIGRVFGQNGGSADQSETGSNLIQLSRFQTFWSEDTGLPPGMSRSCNSGDTGIPCKYGPRSCLSYGPRLALQPATRAGGFGARIVFTVFTGTGVPLPKGFAHMPTLRSWIAGGFAALAVAGASPAFAQSLPAVTIGGGLQSSYRTPTWTTPTAPTSSC